MIGNSVEILGLFVSVYTSRRQSSFGASFCHETDNCEVSFFFLRVSTRCRGAARHINDFMIAKGITSKKLDSSDFLGSLTEQPRNEK